MLFKEGDKLVVRSQMGGWAIRLDDFVCSEESFSSSSSSWSSVIRPYRHDLLAALRSDVVLLESGLVEMWMEVENNEQAGG